MKEIFYAFLNFLFVICITVPILIIIMPIQIIWHKLCELMDSPYHDPHARTLDSEGNWEYINR